MSEYVKSVTVKTLRRGYEISVQGSQHIYFNVCSEELAMQTLDWLKNSPDFEHTSTWDFKVMVFHTYTKRADTTTITDYREFLEWLFPILRADNNQDETKTTGQADD
jgi:hypothetical protein